MLLALEVSTHDELVQVNLLNQQNIRTALTEKERAEEGFVTWLYPMELLQQMHSIAPSIIVKENDTVVGYALVTTKESRTFHADLAVMLDNLEKLNYKGRPLHAHPFYLMGQVCIHKDYRGKGIFKMLFDKHKEVYSNRFDLLVTEIATSNLRSQRAHEKTGFKTIHTYRDAMDDWNVVVWDWNEYAVV